VTVPAHEEVSRDEDSNGVVNPRNLTRSDVVVDQNRDLHPSLPFVRLFAIEEPEVLLDRFHGCDTSDEGQDAENGEGEGVVLLVLFEEEVGPVRDEEESHGETEDREGEEVLLLREETED
jgi:hypothetical protein